MTQRAEAPNVRPGGLVTVAYLKARLDEGSDHLGIFMPLVLDVLSRLPTQRFRTGEVQEALAQGHGVAMPQQTVATLLKRLASKKVLLRESGLFVKNEKHSLPHSDVAGQKARIEDGQGRLAEALRKHAERRGLIIDSTEAALEVLFRFLEAEQVTLLLANPVQISEPPDTTHLERAIIAEFVQELVRDDPALLSVLRGMLEGLVLYHAAFLPDLNAANRHFRNLKVVFDSSLVRQALGYEGAAMGTLMRETIDVLKASGVLCRVFDKTVLEIRRILTMYEARLATPQGRDSLRPVPMARYFITQRFSPSDIREMQALLEREIADIGLQIEAVPKHISEYTGGEVALAARLKGPTAGDELEPRVLHDVDCVSGILTLRRGHRTANLEDAQAVFATSSPLVVRNTRLWWFEDEHEDGIEPVVHIRALTNLAWLKKPKLCVDFKIRELVALCTAALRPEQATWNRFLRHLDTLRGSQKLSSDEVTAILVSAMSDQLLREAESDSDDPSDVDAGTLDDIVDRVIASYEARSSAKVDSVVVEYEAMRVELEKRERAANDRAIAAEQKTAEISRRHELGVEGRARSWAAYISRGVRLFGTILVVAGAFALVTSHPFHGGVIGTIIVLAVAVFVVFECVGVLGHMSRWCSLMELRLTQRFRRWLSNEPKVDKSESRDLSLFR